MNVTDIKENLQKLKKKLKLKNLDLENWKSNFSTITKKGHFPFSFLNLENVDIDYIGKVPSIDYYNRIKKDENKIKKDELL